MNSNVILWPTHRRKATLRCREARAAKRPEPPRKRKRRAAVDGVEEIAW